MQIKKNVNPAEVEIIGNDDAAVASARQWVEELTAGARSRPHRGAENGARTDEVVHVPRRLVGKVIGNKQICLSWFIIQNKFNIKFYVLIEQEREVWLFEDFKMKLALLSV